MKIHSIATDLGPATLASIETPIHRIVAPAGWGLIFWGHKDPIVLTTLALSSRAEWIAVYDRTKKVAIVLYPPEIEGKELEIDTTCVDVTCPKCGSVDYTSNGARLWKCRSCGRQWLKSGAKPRGGKRPGAGRKSA